MAPFGANFSCLHIVFIFINISQVFSHSHVSNIVINGTFYQGFNTKSQLNPHILAAWSTSVQEDGWVGVKDYKGPDIICHIAAENALGHAPVIAGSTIDIQWAGWPESHHGPVLTYLAFCGSMANSCETIDKRDLRFFQIDRAGLIDSGIAASPYATAPGTWGSDLLIANNNSWVVEIPPLLAPGYYVMRHEIIALHFSRIIDMGPQHYPQCFNLEILGNGTEKPSGVIGTELYTSLDPGLVFDIFNTKNDNYAIPGPTLYSGAVTMVSKTLSVVLTTANAVAGTAEPTFVITTLTKPSRKIPTLTTERLHKPTGFRRM
jgi:lytic cellulose monooxygenase (C1-hydroxylating)